MQLQHTKFNRARQPERQMPIMLATYSTNRITVSETIYVIKEKININQAHTYTQTKNEPKKWRRKIVD